VKNLETEKSIADGIANNSYKVEGILFLPQHKQSYFLLGGLLLRPGPEGLPVLLGQFGF